MKLPLIVALSGALAAIALAGPASAASKGYYTAAQAASGAKLYAANCSVCHGAKLEGVSAPPLTGAAMKGSQPIGDIYKYLSTNMPAGRSGQLSPAVYASIMAFILKQNGHPAGKTALTAKTGFKISEKI
jgi:mono/diheme cytochrome c family protein